MGWASLLSLPFFFTFTSLIIPLYRVYRKFTPPTAVVYTPAWCIPP